MIELKLSKKDFKRLDQYPFLKQYVEHFKNTEGESEDQNNLHLLCMY